MKITLRNYIEIETTEENEGQIIERFTFDNPKYNDALQFGRSTYDIDRQICLLGLIDNMLCAPIGTLDYLLENFNPEVLDQRTTVSVQIPFTGTLRPYQDDFIVKALNDKGGQMVAATGSGKTVSGIAMASQLKHIFTGRLRP